MILNGLSTPHMTCDGGADRDAPSTPTDIERYCAITRAMGIIGERWTMLILRDLREGPRKFNDLESSLHGISPNTLSARLKMLGEHGIVMRRFYEDHPPRAEYLLTEKGQELRAVLRALQDWGLKYTA